MVSFEEKAKIEKAGNLNQGHSYVITTVIGLSKPLRHHLLCAWIYAHA